jgi:enoyl-CoA hydratase/carnithine racemase
MNEVTYKTLSDGLGCITIDRPAKRNAFTAEMRHTLYEILRSEQVSNLRCLIFRTEGPMFSAGADLNEVANRDLRHIRASGDLWAQFRQTNPVILTAVQGLALGLGAGIAMASDIVIAAEDAQFGYPEINHGLVASFMTVGLQAVVGTRKAFDLVITGRRVGATEALALGMVTEVVPNDQLTARAMAFGGEIAKRSALAVQTTKRFFYESTEMPFTAANRAAERVVQMIRSSREAQEGAAAFIAKSSPR